MIRPRRRADADVEEWLHVRRVVLPNESAGTVEQFRGRQKPEQLCAARRARRRARRERPRRALGRARAAASSRRACSRRRGGGASARSCSRRLGDARRGAGRRPRRRARRRRRLARIRRALRLRGDRPAGGAGLARRRPSEGRTPAGVELVTVAERPELLDAAYPLAKAGWEDFATAEAVTISREDFVREDATLPEGSFVALAGGEIVGFSGLCAGDHDGVAEDGLTVVHRDWRRRGLARALKARELEWAAANGYREVVTWTQRGERRHARAERAARLRLPRTSASR